MTDEPATKEGDVIIRCFSDKPTPHLVGLVTQDGDLAPYAPKVISGRIDAMIRAEGMRATSGGRIFLHEDDRWIEVKEGSTRPHLVADEAMRKVDQKLTDLMNEAGSTKH